MILRREEWVSPTPKPFLVVGYYTDNTPYQQEAEILRGSLEAMGYPYEICAVPNLGSWLKNTQMKANFMKQMLAEHPGLPLLYLDVDAKMVREPIALFMVRGDIAAARFPKDRELLSGTVYWANTPVCAGVVDRWIALNERFPVNLPGGKPSWDQRTLDMAIQGTPCCNFIELPTEYAWIQDLTERYAPGLQPVIEHTRGAYRLRRIINKGKWR